MGDVVVGETAFVYKGKRDKGESLVKHTREGRNGRRVPGEQAIGEDVSRWGGDGEEGTITQRKTSSPALLCSTTRSQLVHPNMSGLTCHS